jgi:hypothetical protein
MLGVCLGRRVVSQQKHGSDGKEIRGRKDKFGEKPTSMMMTDNVARGRGAGRRWMTLRGGGGGGGGGGGCWQRCQLYPWELLRRGWLVRGAGGCVGNRHNCKEMQSRTSYWSKQQNTNNRT